jgi:hypothetical protein
MPADWEILSDEVAWNARLPGAEDAASLLCTRM